MSRRRMLALAGVAAAAVALGGCGFQPLYGPTLGGDGLADVMAAVEIETVPGRVGQELRNELIFKTTGGREALPPEYRLQIALRESAESTLVQADGDARGLVFGLDADFILVRVADNQSILTSKASARAVYQKVESIFANIRARRDAENRAARTLAEHIRTRVAAFLSARA